MISSAAIYRATRAIPQGRVATYGDIARVIGRMRAWRRVGTVLGQNRDPNTPCHRVVRADGTVGGFGLPGGSREKERRLRAEGVRIVGGRIQLAEFRIVKPLPRIPFSSR